jgi:hypothetical protein
VVEEQNPNSFPSHPWNQSPFDSFLRHQTHCPAGATFGRVAAYHGDDPLSLTGVEHGHRARALFLVERRLQTAFPVTMTYFANGLRSEWDGVGNLRRTNALGQLQQGQGPQDDPNLLDAAAQQVGKLLLILRRDIDTQGWTAHTLSMRENIST